MCVVLSSISQHIVVVVVESVWSAYVPYRTTSESDMHNNHGGRGSPGGHTAVHHHQSSRSYSSPKQMCIDKHDVLQVQASAREDQPGSGADGEYEATDGRQIPTLAS